METLKLRLGENPVRLLYRRPTPAELIDALVMKMPRGSENEDAQRSLLANFELGKKCVAGVGEGDLKIGGKPLITEAGQDGQNPRWLDVLIEFFPLLLIALGQYLSRLPEFMEESLLKKS